MSLRAVLLAGAVGLVGLGGFLLMQTASVTPDGAVRLGKVPAAAAACVEKDCRAPIKVTTVDGREITEEVLAGRVVLLNWWATWCQPCIKEMPALEAVARRHAGELVVIGILVDSSTDAEARRFMDDHGVTYPIVHATPGLDRDFGRPGAIPVSRLYDAAGHEVHTWHKAVSEAELEAAVQRLLAR